MGVNYTPINLLISSEYCFIMSVRERTRTECPVICTAQYTYLAIKLKPITKQLNSFHSSSNPTWDQW